MPSAAGALVAVAVSMALGVDPGALRAGLAALKPVAGRLNPRTGENGLRVIDDSYNANPDSVRAAIDVLVGLPGRHSLVLGDLGELAQGSMSPELEEVAFRYASRPDQTVLDGVSFQVAPGETVALVGPSGADKSTLFDLLMGIVPMDQGDLSWRGQCQTEPPPL